MYNAYVTGDNICAYLCLDALIFTISLITELVDQGHDVTMVAERGDVLQNIQRRFDIKTVVGSPSYPDVLRSANASSMDVMIAVTESDEANMIACQVAYSLFDVPCKIAKIQSEHYLIRNELFSNDNLPIDVFLHPERTAALQLLALLNNPGACIVAPLIDEALFCVAVRLHSTARILGEKIHDCSTMLLRYNAHCVSVRRKEQWLTPMHHGVFAEGDTAYFVVPKSSIQSMLHAIQTPCYKQLNQVIIAGGGRIGMALAEYLMAQGCSVKLLDHCAKRCKVLAKKLPKVVVLQGDASERELLYQEGVDTADVFCALTSDDEDNIISALQAKYLGAKQVLSLVNNSEYMEIFAKSDVDVFIPPQQGTISDILSAIRPAPFRCGITLCRGLAEMVVLTYTDYQSMVGNTRYRSKLPAGVVFCGIWRARVYLADYDASLESGDQLIYWVTDKKNLPLLEHILAV